MKLHEYWRLARLSLRAKKRTTFQSVLGISFGMTLLFPLLFIAIGFYGGFNSEINRNPSFRSMRVTYTESQTVSGKVFCQADREGEIDKIQNVSKSIKYDYLYAQNSSGHAPSFSINGGEPKPMRNMAGRYSTYHFFGIQVIDENDAHQPFLDSDYHLGMQPLLSGSTFSKGASSKGEIMVSSKFTRDFELDRQAIIGSTLTAYNYISSTKTTYSSNDEEIVKPKEYQEQVVVPYFVNYKIVGVYDSDVYYSRSPRYYSLQFNETSAEVDRFYARDYFWISSASLGEKGEAVAPRRVFHPVEGQNQTMTSWFVYDEKPETLAKKTTDAGYAFFPMGLGTFSRANFYPTYTKTQILEFPSFQKARYGYEDILQQYRLSVTGDPDNLSLYHYDPRIVPEAFFTCAAFFDRFLYICVGLGAFGGVIFLATLLNLINTMHFSVESMKGFLGMCRAQGMRRKGVIQIFLAQINVIFSRGYIPTILLGGGACVATKLIFDATIQSQIKLDSNMNLTIEWWYIPIALGVLVAVTTILSLLISRLLAGKVAKTPILEILTEENRM